MCVEWSKTLHFSPLPPSTPHPGGRAWQNTLSDHIRLDLLPQAAGGPFARVGGGGGAAGRGGANEAGENITRLVLFR